MGFASRVKEDVDSRIKSEILIRKSGHGGGCCQGKSFSKLVVALVGLVFVILSIVLWSLSGYYMSKYEDYHQFLHAKFLFGPSMRLTLVGLLFFSIGILAMLELFVKGNVCIHVSLSILLFTLLTLLLSSVAVFNFYRSSVSANILQQSVNVLKTYGTNGSLIDGQVDFIQQQLQCCGIKSHADWLNRSYPFALAHPSSVPKSCCNTTMSETPCKLTKTGTVYVGTFRGLIEAPKMIYTVGCYDKLSELFIHNYSYVISLFTAFIVFLVLGLISTCTLYCLQRRERRRQRRHRLGGLNSSSTSTNAGGGGLSSSSLNGDNNSFSPYFQMKTDDLHHYNDDDDEDGDDDEFVIHRHSRQNNINNNDYNRRQKGGRFDSLSADDDDDEDVYSMDGF